PSGVLCKVGPKSSDVGETAAQAATPAQAPAADNVKMPAFTRAFSHADFFLAKPTGRRSPRLARAHLPQISRPARVTLGRILASKTLRTVARRTWFSRAF